MSGPPYPRFGIIPTVIPATWNPAFLAAGITLSNNNLTLTAGTVGTNTASRSIISFTSGKYYAEFTMNSVVTGLGIGICTAAEATTDNLGGTANGIIALSDGNIYFDFPFFSAAVASFGSSLAIGDVIGMAVDIDNLAIWFRKNGGNWNNSATANPTTNTGGVSLLNPGAAIGGGPALPPPPYFVAAQCRTSDVGTANFGGKFYIYAPPTLFQNWVSQTVNAAPGSNAIGSFVIGGSPIGTIPTFDPWATIIGQYANSPIIDSIITSFNSAMDQTTNMDSFYDLIFNIQTASGYGLDVLGRIVNVARGQNVTSDSDFRNLIFAAMLGNICNGSIPAYNAILMFIYGQQGQVYIINDANQSFSVLFAYPALLLGTGNQQTIFQTVKAIGFPAGVAVSIGQEA